jgi:hypothetical protein
MQNLLHGSGGMDMTLERRNDRMEDYDHKSDDEQPLTGTMDSALRHCPICGRMMPLVIVGYDGDILSGTMIYGPNEQGLYHCRYCDWTVEVI